MKKVPMCPFLKGDFFQIDTLKKLEVSPYCFFKVSHRETHGGFFPMQKVSHFDAENGQKVSHTDHMASALYLVMGRPPVVSR